MIFNRNNGMGPRREMHLILPSHNSANPKMIWARKVHLLSPILGRKFISASSPLTLREILIRHSGETSSHWISIEDKLFTWTFSIFGYQIVFFVNKTCAKNLKTDTCCTNKKEWPLWASEERCAHLLLVEIKIQSSWFVMCHMWRIANHRLWEFL